MFGAIVIEFLLFGCGIGAVLVLNLGEGLVLLVTVLERRSSSLASESQLILLSFRCKKQKKKSSILFGWQTRSLSSV